MQMIFSATKKFIINFPKIGKKKKSKINRAYEAKEILTNKTFFFFM